MNDRKPDPSNYLVVDVHAYAMRNEEGQNGGLRFEIRGLIDLSDADLSKLTDAIMEAAQTHLIEEGWMASDTVRVELDEQGGGVIERPEGEMLQ